MLNKELSHFSESKSGNQISEYICNTFLGKYILNTYSRVVVNALSNTSSFQINNRSVICLFTEEAQVQQGPHRV